MKPIKVCHIVNLITGKADGVYTHLKMIFKNYDKDKFEHYLIFQGGDKIEREVRAFGVKVFTSASLKKKISLKAFLDIYKVLKKAEVDVIHTHMIKPYAIAGLVNIIVGKKFIFNYHGLFLKDNLYYSLIEKLIYRTIHFLVSFLSKVDVVLVPSKRSKCLLEKETKLFPEPVVYYNGMTISMENIQPNPKIEAKLQEIRNNESIVALIGRLEIDKRVDRAIILTKKLTNQQKKIRLLIFGDGSLKDDLQRRVDELGLNDIVEFLGFVDALQHYYKFFDIVLFTSDWEGMPLTMWEAIAHEVPVVAPDGGGLKEILEEDK